VFIALTLGASFFVFWGPLALFKVPTISFVSVEKGPVWAILLFILGGFVPSLAGLFLTWRTEGAAGLRRLGRRMIQFNIGWRGYLAAVGLVLFATLCQILIINLMGQSFDATVFLAQLGSFLPLLILGPLSEELGWRGYALDRLQARFSPLVSSVLLGSAWAVWHLPLFFMPGTSQHELGIPFVPFFFTILGLTVLFTWQHNATGGSLWTAIFFHWIYTYASQTVSSGVIQYPIYHWFGTIPYLLAALLVIAFWKPAKAPSAEVSPQIS
jgi:membrane protease YdiL (CAAX protease family)